MNNNYKLILFNSMKITDSSKEKNSRSKKQNNEK